MRLKQIDQQLAHLRGELDRLDHTGQPTASIVAEIGKLEKQRDGLVAGMDTLDLPPRWRSVCEHIVDKLLETDALKSRVERVVEIAERFLDDLDAAPIESVWLVGSRAEETSHTGSDWDWLVVGEDFDSVEAERISRLEAGERLFGLSLDVDVARRGDFNDIIFSSNPPPPSQKALKVYPA